METKIKVILISQVPLPYSQIGSWTTLYKSYLKSENLTNAIVCEQPEILFPNIEYSVVSRKFRDTIQSKFFKNKKTEYLSALNSALNKNERFVIQVVDNYGLVKPLNDFLVQRGLRTKCYIQFFYHGFDPYQQSDSGTNFYNIVDEIVILTNSSYSAFKNQVAVLPNYFSILHNGIDTSKFLKISSLQKAEIRHDLNLSDKKVFLWCSQDRPKKGLHLVLDAWNKIVQKYKDVVLLIIGCDPKIDSATVKYLGRIPNEELSKYYQIADCYLFSTLCHEGFGMSLIEALHCGCYCIASALGGMPEVLQYGKYGKLIENPHFVSEWVKAIEEFLNSDFRYPELPKDLYSTETWNHEMNQIIQTAKERLAQR